MRNIWMKVAATALSLLMLASFAACGDDKGSGGEEGPTTVPTARPTLPPSSSNQDKEFVLNGTDGLDYTANTAGTTCYLSGLGTFEGTKLIIPDVVLGAGDRRQTVIGIRATTFTNEVAATVTEIDIPSSVKKIDAGVFDGCTSLETIRYFGSEDLWKEILATENVTVPEGVNVLFCKYYDLTVEYVYYADGSEVQEEFVKSYINDSPFTVEVPAKEGYRADIDVASGVMTGNTTVVITYVKILGEGRCGDDLTWTFYEDNRLDIKGSGTMYDYSADTTPWGYYANRITNVLLDDAVASIGAYAFADCTSVETMVLPENLLSVGAYAFRGWVDTQTVEFSGGVNILTMMDAVWNSDLSATIRFRYGSYEQDANLENGKEPIVWTLVDQDNGSYLLTVLYAIEMRPYHDIPVETTWEDSSLRAWLQSDFANSAFTADELASQVTMQKDIGTATDKLFLFSAAELASLFEDEELRVRLATAYANPVYVETEEEDGSITTSITASEEGVYWWLRDGGALGRLAQNVSPEGVTNTDGALVSTANRGVSISVWVKPSSN